jgi:hypothetical protein
MTTTADPWRIKAWSAGSWSESQEDLARGLRGMEIARDVRSCTLMRRAFSSISSPMKSSEQNQSHALSNSCNASSRGDRDKTV